ncbi:hypothetical protein AYO38_02695 [bacterium SCGC AG-212-C10]|nr:hypothetical protein AYO38_02695 [bacterium SCGC AG-212-C10]
MDALRSRTREKGCLLMVERRLLVRVPGAPVSEHVLGLSPTVVGRDTGCDVCVASKYVSRRHFRLEAGNDGALILADLGGANGVLVNGTRVHGSVQLRNDDMIRIADVTIEYQETAAEHSGTMVFSARPTEHHDAGSRDAIQRITKSIWGNQHLGPGGTVSIMFTDIEDSTSLVGSLGDAAAQQVVQQHNDVLRQQFAAFRGYEAKRQGDGFLVLFASARDALGAAVAIQRRLRDEDAASGAAPVRVRIGIHVGEVLWDHDDIFGSAVNFAARVSSQARGGEIVISSLLREIVAPTGEFAFGVARGVELKGFEGQHRVFTVEWADPHASAVVHASGK